MEEKEVLKAVARALSRESILHVLGGRVNMPEPLWSVYVDLVVQDMNVDLHDANSKYRLFFSGSEVTVMLKGNGRA
jgi:hypothetical protein